MHSALLLGGQQIHPSAAAHRQGRGHVLLTRFGIHGGFRPTSIATDGILGHVHTF